MKNSTIVSKEFQVYKEGYFINGRNYNGTCINRTSSNTNQIINSHYDRPLKFKQDILYACNKNLTFNEFYSFCINKKWQNLAIFNIQNDNIFLGKYGSSEVVYKSVIFLLFMINLKIFYKKIFYFIICFINKKDWVEVIKQVNLDSTYWASDNRTCTIPTSINLDILYNKAGYLNNKQYSIITGNLYSKYE
jgi:hypothetical protein